MEITLQTMFLLLSLVLLHASVCFTQSIYRNPKSKNPFQPPKFEGNDQWTTPSDVDTTETQTTAEPSKEPSREPVVRIKEKVRSGSPFSPPVKSEWYKTEEEAEEEEAQSSAWLSSLEARQQHNTQLIPDLSKIDLNKEHHKNLVETPKIEESRRPKLRAKRPKISVYQHRDMHDTAPGVTPWTRYTEKPKLPEDNGWSSGGKTYAQCGYQSYSPRNQICCQGQVLRRQGIQPSCCGGQAFDNVFSKCCNGVVSLKSSQNPNC